MPDSWQQAFHRRAPDVGALLIVALLTLLFFRPVLLEGAWLPAGGGDNVSFIFPMYRFIAGSLAQGELPLWNPYQYAGYPLIADNQAGIFYPPNLLLFLLNPNFSYAAIEALVMFHIFLAGAGTYLCARSWRLQRPIPRVAALIGAVAYMFSGVFLTHIGNLNLIAVAAWLPLVFFAFYRAVHATSKRASLRYGLASGIALGISTLAGHAQISFYLALWLALYALYRTLKARDGRPLLLLALVGAVAAGLAAASLLPALGLQAQSLRESFTYENAANYSLPPAGLLGLIAPDFFGRSGNFWGPWARVEYGYMGILPWLLAAVALGWEEIGERWFLAGAALFFVLLALGSNTPVHRLFFTVLPLPFQVPARFMLLVNFAVALLAALGATRLLESAQPRNRRLWLLLAAVLLLGGAALLGARVHWGEIYPARRWQMARATLVFAGLAGAGWLLLFVRARGRLSPRLFGWLGLLLLSLDLISLGQYLEVEWTDPLRGYDNPAAVNYLQEHAGVARIDDGSGQWQPGAAQMFGLYEIGGVYNPLQLGRYTIYVGAVGYRGSPLHSLLGVEYVVGDKDEPPGDTHFIVPTFAKDPDVTIYRNTNVLPRAMVLHQSQVVSNPEAAFAAIHAPDFDPAGTVILEGGKSLAQPPGSYDVQWLVYGNNEARFRVTTDRDGYFLLSDVYYPDWEATVNGEPVPILVADYAFRAVFLEAGTHRVNMRFAPRSWYWGATLSLFTLAGVVVLLALTGWERFISD
mgnify:CR=1 FL=1